MTNPRGRRRFVTEIFPFRSGARVLLATLASAADVHLDEAAGMSIVPNTAGGEQLFVPTGGRGGGCALARPSGRG